MYFIEIYSVNVYLCVKLFFKKKIDEFVFCKDKFDLLKKKVLFEINFFVICG